MKTRSWLELYVPRDASDVLEEDGLFTEHVLTLSSFDAELVSRIYPLDKRRQTIKRHSLPSAFTLVTWVGCNATVHADNDQTPLYYVKAGDIAAISLEYQPSDVLNRATLAYFGGLPADYPVIPMLYHRTDQQY